MHDGLQGQTFPLAPPLENVSGQAQKSKSPAVFATGSLVVESFPTTIIILFYNSSRDRPLVQIDRWTPTEKGGRRLKSFCARGRHLDAYAGVPASARQRRESGSGNCRGVGGEAEEKWPLRLTRRSSPSRSRSVSLFAQNVALDTDDSLGSEGVATGSSRWVGK